MRPEKYTANDLHNYLKKNMIASMDELNVNSGLKTSQNQV